MKKILFFTITQELMSLANTEMVVCVDRTTNKNTDPTSGSYCDIRFTSSDVTATRIDSTHVHVYGSKTVEKRTVVVDLTFEYDPNGSLGQWGTTENVTGSIHCTCSDPNDANGLPATVTFDHTTNSAEGEYPVRMITAGSMFGEIGSSNDLTRYTVNIYYSGYPY